jgi:hypothetical protein
MDEATAELLMLALIFTRKFLPMTIGLTGWLMLAGMMARPPFAHEFGRDELNARTCGSPGAGG